MLRTGSASIHASVLAAVTRGRAGGHRAPTSALCTSALRFQPSASVNYNRACGSVGVAGDSTYFGHNGVNGHHNGVNGLNGHHPHGGAEHAKVDGMAILQREVAALMDEVRQRDAVIVELRARVKGLERQAAQRHDGSAPEAATDAAGPSPAEAEFPDGAVVVQTSSELAAALENRATVIAVPRGTVLRAASLCADNHAVTICGPRGCPAAERPVIEGHFNAKGAKAALALSDVHVRAAAASEPCIAAAGAANVTLTRVTVSGGRDGVYLMGTASLAATEATFSENVRGVFESLRCRATLHRCSFERNLFHCVLLAPHATKGAPKTQRVADDVTSQQNAFVGGRCDVALQHNPIEDSYSLTFRGGRAVELTPEEASSGLVDAAW